MKCAALRTAPLIIIAMKAILLKRIFLNRIRKNILVFEILFQPDAASHDAGEVGIVHRGAAGIRDEVFFRDVFRNPANAGGNASKSC